MPARLRFSLLATILFTPLAHGQQIADTTKSPHAAIKPVKIDEVRWTDGFWADRVDTCHNKSVPAMWELMRDGTYKPFLEHFLIAAGKAEGDYHGAQWNDGDFYKWLEAAIATWAVTKDEELGKAIDTSIAAIAAAQRDDGYIHTPVLIRVRNGDTTAKPFENRMNFEMYNMGHLITTGCLHHRVTGKTDLLAVAEKAAQFMIDTFSSPTPELARNAVCPSHYMAAVELYRTTGKPEYLKLAKTFLEMRNLVTDGGDDNQDLVPFTDQREAVGHAVRANYLYAGAADLYAETGDESLMNPMQAIWNNMVQKKLYITGACGALYDGASPDGSSDQGHITRTHQSFGRNYQLPNTTAHNETCANIAGAMWNWRMFLLTGEAKYIDVMETALYNSILSGVSLDGTEFFYVNPLRVVDPLPVELRYPRTRQKFFSSFCCPPNVVRTIAELGGYAYSKTDDSILVNLYGSNTLETTLLDSPLKITQETQYPWDGKIKLTIDECPNKEFAIKLRIPAWCNGASISINGESVARGGVAKKSPSPVLGGGARGGGNELRGNDQLATDSDTPPPSGYQEIHRQWKPGDTIELDLPMPAQLIEAHPLVEEVQHQVAVKRGPVVYCLESADLPEGVEVENVVIPADAKLTPEYQANALDGVATITTEAIAETNPTWTGGLYRPKQTEGEKRIPLKLVPYYAWANRGAGEMTVWLPVR
jgi:DUF1680 family protein